MCRKYPLQPGGMVCTKGQHVTSFFP